MAERPVAAKRRRRRQRPHQPLHGVVLVTGLRLVQVGMGRIADERAAAEES